MILQLGYSGLNIRYRIPILWTVVCKLCADDSTSEHEFWRFYGDDAFKGEESVTMTTLQVEILQ